MTEQALRNAVIEKARSWLGYSEENQHFQIIIDIYNNCCPLPRGYRMKYSDPWCATFVSTVGIVMGVNDIMPSECSCSVMIAKYKDLGRWVEDDNYTPQIADVIFYDWGDDGVGDCVGEADHVGIVSAVNGSKITVIEGNMSNAVGERKITVGARYIRGYGVPDYAGVCAYADAWVGDLPMPEQGTAGGTQESAKPEAPIWKGVPTLWKGTASDAVAAMQHILLTAGYALPRYGADGDFGDETEAALETFQAGVGIPVTGACDKATWAAMIGGAAV